MGPSKISVQFHACFQINSDITGVGIKKFGYRHSYAKLAHIHENFHYPNTTREPLL